MRQLLILPMLLLPVSAFANSLFGNDNLQTNDSEPTMDEDQTSECTEETDCIPWWLFDSFSGPTQADICNDIKNQYDQAMEDYRDAFTDGLDCDRVTSCTDEERADIAQRQLEAFNTFMAMKAEFEEEECNKIMSLD